MAKGKKPLVVVTRKLPDTVETRMRELFDARLNLDDKPMSQAELAEAVKVADVLVPTVTDRIDSALLGQSGDRLRLIANYGNGVDQMLARMDIISINCPHTPATYHLLSARRLKLIRAEAYVVNTARGEVIDENALTRMIEAGEIAGAGLDVFEHEPAVNPKLVRLARSGKVVILPHMGSATIEGRVDMGDKVIINIRTFMDGHRPPDRVLPSML